MEPIQLHKLWINCLANDRKAQSELYRYFASKMYAVCLRYAENSEAAQDILQNGFIKVFGRAKDYSGTGSLEGWIRRIMLNTAIEHYRKNKNLIFQTDSLSDRDFESTSSSSLQHLNYKDLLALVQKLPLGYRTIFNLYAIEGYNHKEIAEMLDISEGNSKSQLSRARQSLKERIMKLEEITDERSRF